MRPLGGNADVSENILGEKERRTVMKRRAIVSVFLVFLTIFFLTSGIAFAAPAGKIKIVHMFGKPEFAEGMAKVEALYEKSHPNIDLQYDLIHVNNVSEEAKTRLASGTLPQVMDQGSQGKTMLLWLEHLVPITKTKVPKALTPAATASSTYNGEVYGAAIYMMVHGQAYNMDLLKKVGVTSVPKTKTDFRNLVDKVQKANLGSLLVLNDWTMLLHMFGSISANSGKDPVAYMKAMTAGQVDPATAQEWVLFWDWLDFALKNCQPNPVGADKDLTRMQFYGSKAAINYHEGSWLASSAANVDKTFETRCEIGPYCYSDDPKWNVNGIQPYSFCVTKYGDTKAALEYFEWLFTNDAAMDIMVADCRILPTRLGYKISPEKIDAVSYKVYQQMQSGGKFVTNNLWLEYAMIKELAAISQRYASGLLDRKSAGTEIVALYKSYADK
jgi:raffinose/stachyose/melibiose transport system substrate-binding protein